MTDTKESAKKRDEIRVVDRRLFNAEGELRDPARPDVPHEPMAPPPDPRPAAGRMETAAKPGGGSAESRLASAHFRSLVMNLATTAAANLGEMPNPFTQQTEIDLEGARQVIDLLLALQTKTRGNLTVEEERLLDSLLYDLQMKFVALQTRVSKPL
ncbi:MAG TPA: DUF1844 domain-containing protein [Candidatus Polarisedimenticolia bacterium]